MIYRIFGLLLVLFLTLPLGACSPDAGTGSGSVTGGKSPFQGTDITGVDWGKDLQLTDHNGKRRSLADFHGKVVVLFFGYTHCPDVCPTELQVMAEALKQLGPRGESITPVFISIDPERDTPEILKSYVENFDPRLVGLTGTPDETAAVAKAYRAYYAKAGKTESPDYLMDHSSIIYLMDRQGRFLKHFTYTTDAKALAEGLLAAMAASP